MNELQVVTTNHGQTEAKFESQALLSEQNSKKRNKQNVVVINMEVNRRVHYFCQLNKVKVCVSKDKNWTLYWKTISFSSPAVATYAAVNHLSGPLGETTKVLHWVQKVTFLSSEQRF